MAYPKITVNTGLALSLIASDTLPIPSPDLPQITGTADTDVTDKLKDTTANFSTVNVSIKTPNIYFKQTMVHAQS